MSGFRADRLRTIREFKGLSQNELASRSGVDVSGISRYEKEDGQKPSCRILGQLADALDISADFLLGRDNFDGLPIRDLAVRESFGAFVRRVSVAEADRDRLRRMMAHERAPKTVDEWTTIHELTATRKAPRAHRREPQAAIDAPAARSQQRNLRAVPKKRL